MFCTDGKQKKTIGKINEDLEITKFKTNALPLYVIADHNGNPLNNQCPPILRFKNIKTGSMKEWNYSIINNIVHSI